MPDEVILYLETQGSVPIPTPEGTIQYCPRDGTIHPQVGYTNRKGERMIWQKGRRVRLALIIYEHLFSPLMENQDLRFLDKDRSNLCIRNLYVKTLFVDQTTENPHARAQSIRPGGL